jgi:hypothetical protein
MLILLTMPTIMLVIFLLAIAQVIVFSYFMGVRTGELMGKREARAELNKAVEGWKHIAQEFRAIADFYKLQNLIKAVKRKKL